MQRRVCDFLLYGESKVGSAQCSVYNTLNDKLCAISDRYDTDKEMNLSQLPAGKHLVPVKASVQSADVIAAEELLDTLVYACIDAGTVTRKAVSCAISGKQMFISSQCILDITRHLIG